VSSYHDNKVLFALPIDDSQINNCVLVYNTLTKHWSGADIGAAVNVRDWLKLEYAGAIRLAYISHDGFIYLHEDGFLDDLGSPTGLVTPASIETRLITRGYGGQIPGRKNFGRASVRVSTWWPTGSVSLHMDGVVEGRGLGPLGPFSRVVYRRPHGRRDWRPTNINDDFLAPHREDYSLILTTPEEMQTGDAGLLGELHQSIDKGWRLRGRGKYAQLEISTTQGRIELRDCGVEAYRGSPRDGAQS
jgi:hypothetical protein